ncbi:MAG: hypothetical protein OK457_06010 [Thaumarchaeota archaeon]|nr:hypothetical protein [Nitrososphaerota archaeon]
MTLKKMSRKQSLRRKIKEPKGRKESEENVVEGLMRSKQRMPQLYPKLLAGDGELLDGNSRGEAGFSDSKTLDWVKTEKDKILVKAAANYRRAVGSEETRRIIVSMAEILEKEGVKKKKMISELKKELPYSDRTIREYLPDKFKQIEKKRKPRQKALKSAEAPPRNAGRKEAGNSPGPQNPQGGSAEQETPNGSDADKQQPPEWQRFEFMRELRNVLVKITLKVRTSVALSEGDFEIELQ